MILQDIEHIVLRARKELGTSATLKDLQQWLEKSYDHKAGIFARSIKQGLKLARLHDIDKLITRLSRSIPKTRISHHEIDKFAKKRI